jgi:hypothetical protein
MNFYGLHINYLGSAVLAPLVCLLLYLENGNITEKGKAYVWYLILDVLLLIHKKKLLSPHHLLAMLLSPPWISFPLVTQMLLCCFHHHCTLVYVTRTIHVISFTTTNCIIGISATIIVAAVAVNTMANTVIGTHHHHCHRPNCHSSLYCHQHHHYIHNNSGSLNIVDFFFLGIITP